MVQYDCEGCGIHATNDVGEVPPDHFCPTCRFLNGYFYTQPKEEGHEPGLRQMFVIYKALINARERA